MNILIPHQWLLKHLKTNAKPKQIQEQLSLSGPSVENIYHREGDDIYDIEVTTNRVDSMSVRGIAREAAVILSRYGFKAALKPLDLKSKTKLETTALPLPKINNEAGLSNRILCVVLGNVQHKPTPKWMAKLLKQIDINVHDSVIDITNYVTHDLGHPCHAFDYDKIMELGGIINIVEAKAGKPFTTLDGEEYETVGGEVVFTNDVGTIIDLPAIKGTLNSSVDDQTQNVLFWIENLDAQKVRFGSMSHAIRTMAAQLNEKNVDAHLGKTVLLSGIELYRELTKAKVASEIYDDFPGEAELKPVVIDKNMIDNYLGLELEESQITEILNQLDCEVSTETTTKEILFTVSPPTFRPDLKIKVDIIEEIARIYGYHNLPSQLMATPLPVNAPADTSFRLETQIKYFLSAIGWQEIYSLSLVSDELAQQSGYSLDEHLGLQNPLTTDHIHLRRSLIPSLHQAIATNPQIEKLSVFELANVYRPQKNKLPKHVMKLGLVSKRSYREVRGNLENLLAKFYIKSIKVVPIETKVKPESTQLSTQQGEIFVEVDELNRDSDSVSLGFMHVLTTKEVAVEIDLTSLLNVARSYPQYKATPKTTPIIEDLTFTLSLDTPVGELIAAITDSHQLIKQVELKDVFQQNYTFTVQYQDELNNLTNEIVTPIRQELVKVVEDQFKAKLVGQV